MSNEPRPAVTRFAREMEKKLQQNDHKGGWEDCTAEDLMRMLKDEVRELERALRTPCPNCGREMLPQHMENVASEAADVANFAMMLYDNHYRKVKA